MAEPRRRPGEDAPVSPADDLTVLRAVRAYKVEAREAKYTRMLRNRENRQAYLGRGDFRHKQKGQSTEFIPKTAVAVEQLVGFVKRALTQFGAWYDVELARGSKSPLGGFQIRELMDCFLDTTLTEGGQERPFSVILGDALKAGALESLMVFKVHGQMVGDPSSRLEEGEKLTEATFESWRLRIDSVRNEDYFPDPTGRNLYEIQSTEVDLHEVIKRAEDGIYDKAAVAQLQEDFSKEDDLRENRRRPADQDQDEAESPAFRKRVVVDEFWGDILDSDGHMVMKNAFCAIANEKFIIRKPKPNPFWHGRSPFVATPLIRVPFSTWHKALMDHAVQLNLALNELFNLIIDGGLASVWGVRQARLDDIENPDELSDGVPQGATIAVKNTLPHGQKAIETVTTGDVPTDAMAVFEMLGREFSSAALSNELKLGAFPRGEVKATEVVEMSQTQAVTLDAIVGDLEKGHVVKVLTLSWLTILQNLDNVSAQTIANAVGPSAAFDLAQMDAVERYKLFSQSCAFKVFGLSATLARVRDFQKFMALMQAVTANPLLMMSFFRKYSPDKVLSHLMKTLNINPEQMNKSAEEIDRVQDDVKELGMFQQMMSPRQQQGPTAENTGTPELPAEIQQAANPLTGMVG